MQLLIYPVIFEQHEQMVTAWVPDLDFKVNGSSHRIVVEQIRIFLTDVIQKRPLPVPSELCDYKVGKHELAAYVAFDVAVLKNEPSGWTFRQMMRTAWELRMGVNCI
ncbi:hypothetical protein IV38_GL000164 [Lactobacillus selangorensis]|uniref:HicB-like antitoxin of toxin-antitoxin system domain-containing protein n=1 Tax=Lactobacillus selangorensis TaxID=81857 RepID=A0A0R2FKY5_9LACO|nr:hypothetical protein [Lactobacillus selangorensis]KRN29282.1 hypothetical protein IV38_GL000164 [Lactobacillus selangorensis]KRN34189.1 hypothetical protein IV40_GL000505 [Lactobacillus selangorensis]